MYISNPRKPLENRQLGSRLWYGMLWYGSYAMFIIKQGNCFPVEGNKYLMIIARYCFNYSVGKKAL